MNTMMHLTYRCASALVIFIFFDVCHANSQCSISNVERMESEGYLPPIWNQRPYFSCAMPNIDAAVMTMDQRTYFFKGHYYWRLINNTVAAGYPRLITQDWDGLPPNIDAALTWKDGRTFFFKDTEYWSFHNKVRDPDYPRPISEGFCGIPDRLDAALLWVPNGHAYFFKGEKYWLFAGGEAETVIHPDYPLNIVDHWAGIPSNLDAAFQWHNGRTYFFKGSHYFRYDDHGNDAEAGQAKAMVGEWGLSCTDLRARLPSSS